jgi:hypothetical protein
MTTLTLSHLIHETPVLNRLVASLSALFAGIADARRMAHDYDELSRLSDAELAARGLARPDIPRAVIGAKRA